jgi:CheY-like chemotaxis protein
MKILVVDDDEVVLRWVRKQLERRRCEVEDAFSGEQGLHSYLSQGPTTWDFVLTDYLFIPSTRVQNGLHLVRKICAINPKQRMAIHTSEKGLLAPVPVLQKPYPIENLLRLLRKPVLRIAGPGAD